MREIKFRAWDEVRKQWIYLDLVDLITKQLERQGFSSMRVVNWCRWTGLKDKNGVEIYEGDIVKILDISGSGQTREFIREVKWFGHGYASYLETYGIEVIGNIMENPELLRGNNLEARLSKESDNIAIKEQEKTS